MSVPWLWQPRWHDALGGDLDNLPIARRMRWGAGSQEFVRPVHWVVMLFGSSVVEAEILGIPAGKQTQGHRFHGPKLLAITNPAKYAEVLLEKAHVVADVAADDGAVVQTYRPAKIMELEIKWLQLTDTHQSIKFAILYQLGVEFIGD